MPGGRPMTFKTVEELQTKIDEYFDENPKKPTICGLALELGFLGRQSIYDYINRDDEFSYTIEKAVSRIEQKHEEGLYNPANSGHIFWLKNRNWTDKQDINLGGEVGIKGINYVKPSE
jgi:hypothetical protein